jgi:hypothetical protein
MKTVACNTRIYIEEGKLMSLFGSGSGTRTVVVKTASRDKDGSLRPPVEGEHAPAQVSANLKIKLILTQMFQVFCCRG